MGCISACFPSLSLSLSGPIPLQTESGSESHRDAPHDETITSPFLCVCVHSVVEGVRGRRTFPGFRRRFFFSLHLLFPFFFFPGEGGEERRELSTLGSWLVRCAACMWLAVRLVFFWEIDRDGSLWPEFMSLLLSLFLLVREVCGRSSG